MKILYELSKDQFTVMKGLVDILFLVTCITKVRSSDLPSNFVGDFIDNLGITDLTFVFGDTSIPSFSNIFNMSIITRFKWIYHSGPESMNETLSEIMGMQITSSNSAIFFDGCELMPVLNGLDSQDFFQKDIICMLNYELLSANLDWRLDSKVFFYDIKSTEKVTLTEKYAIKGGQPIVRELVAWMKDTGFRNSDPTQDHLSLKCLHSLRSDLMGVNLVNAAIEWPREVYFIRDSNGSIIGSTGYLQEILQALQLALNFTVVNTTPADGKYGGLEDDNKTWNGLIGLLDKKNADIVTSPMTSTEARSKVVDFTYAVAHDKITLVAKKLTTNIPNIWVYIRIFSPVAWLCICCILILLALSLTFFGWFDPGASSSICIAISACYKMLLQLSPDLTTEFASLKILLMTASFYGYLIFAIYAADLVANMTIRSGELPIQNFKDVLEQGFQVYVWEDAIEQQIMANAIPGSAMHEVYYKTMHKNNQAFFTDVDTMTQILNQNPKALIFGYSGIILRINNKDWQALQIDEMKWAYGSFAVQKNSELTGILR